MERVIGRRGFLDLLKKISKIRLKVKKTETLI